MPVIGMERSTIVMGSMGAPLFPQSVCAMFRFARSQLELKRHEIVLGCLTDDESERNAFQSFAPSDTAIQYITLKPVLGAPAGTVSFQLCVPIAIVKSVHTAVSNHPLCFLFSVLTFDVIAT